MSFFSISNAPSGQFSAKSYKNFIFSGTKVVDHCTTYSFCATARNDTVA
jgi:hypothetical protein